MTAQLFFLYDSHCPWSYVATPLVNEINKAFPNIKLHLWHTAFYDGKGNDNVSSSKNINEVEKLANICFSEHYRNIITQNKNSTLVANLMTWAQAKTPSLALSLLQSIQAEHFEHGNELIKQTDLESIITELKLSPPAKVFKSDKLSNDVLIQLEEIFALQEIIQTEAIPALLLAIDDELILLNHHFYLAQPNAIVEAVQLELDKHHL